MFGNADDWNSIGRFEASRTYKKQKDHATDMSFENEIKYDG